MVDINRHRFFLVQILKDIYTDLELANCLGFKGGNALMFLYDLPRFSVDLDFNLLDFSKTDIHEHLNWIETLATLVIRLIKEDKKWVLILAPLIFFVGRLLDMSRKILIKRFNTDYIASGYLVVAIK